VKPEVFVAGGIHALPDCTRPEKPRTGRTVLMQPKKTSLKYQHEAIVLVLPDNRAPAYEVQTITDVDYSKRNEECPTFWPQYKLAMTEAVLWSKPYSSHVLDPQLVLGDPNVEADSR